MKNRMKSDNAEKSKRLTDHLTQHVNPDQNLMRMLIGVVHPAVYVCVCWWRPFRFVLCCVFRAVHIGLHLCLDFSAAAFARPTVRSQQCRRWPPLARSDALTHKALEWNKQVLQSWLRKFIARCYSSVATLMNLTNSENYQAAAANKMPPSTPGRKSTARKSDNCGPTDSVLRALGKLLSALPGRAC